MFHRPHLRSLSAVAALAGLLAMPTRGHAEDAYDWYVANVRVAVIELSYMPGEIQFAIDTKAGNCVAGTHLRWRGYGADEAVRQANVKSVLAALLMAKASNTPLQLYGKNVDCEVKFFYLG